MTARTYIHCPHCGEQIAAQGMGRHATACIERPGIRDLVRAIMDPDETGFGVPRSEYSARAAAYNDNRRAEMPAAPSQRNIEQALGSWTAVYLWAGLDAPERRGRTREEALTQEDAAIAEVAIQVQRSREAVRESDGGDGLQVSRVRTVGKCTYYELR